MLDGSRKWMTTRGVMKRRATVDSIDKNCKLRSARMKTLCSCAVI